MDYIDNIIENHENTSWTETKNKLVQYMDQLNKDVELSVIYDIEINSYDDYITYRSELQKLVDSDMNDVDVREHVIMVKRINYLFTLCQNYLEKQKMAVKIIKSEI